MNIITKYFADLSPLQAERLAQHSLAIAKTCTLVKGAEILDVGTGGGFPYSFFFVRCGKCCIFAENSNSHYGIL